MAAPKRPSAKGTPTGRQKSLPLALRLPNAPSPFVGREDETRALVEAVGRGPVSLVVGPEGIGKSALILSTLHTHFADRVPRTLFLRLPPEQPADQVRQEMLRAVAKAADQKVDWSGLQSDAERTTAELLDIAEEHAFWMVVDGLPTGEGSLLADLLVQLASYARNSRFIAASLSAPQVRELAGQVVHLGAMPEGDLLALGTAFAPSVPKDALRRAVASSGGAPWLYLQRLSGGMDAEEGSLTDGLPDDAVGFVRDLASLSVPLPESLIARFGSLPSEASMAILAARGLIERSASGIALHPMLRNALASSDQADAARARALGILATESLPDAQLECVRLLAETGQMGRLEALLEERADELIEKGYTPRLFALIRQLGHAPIAHWQRRCAAELGNPTALAQVHEPDSDDVAEMLDWARTLSAQGAIDEAIRCATSIVQHAQEHPNAEVSLEATLLLADNLRRAARYDEAITLLGSLDYASHDVRFTAEAALMRCRAEAGLERDAERLFRLKGRAERGEAPEEALLGIAAGLEQLAQLEATSQVLELLAKSPRGGQPTHLAAREAMQLSAWVSCERGELGRARELLESLQPFARGASAIRPALDLIGAAVRLASGELAGLGQTLAASMARGGGEAWVGAQLQSHSLRLDIEHAKAKEGEVSLIWQEGPPAAIESMLVATLHRVRMTGSGNLPDLNPWLRHPRTAVWARLCGACAALCSGDAKGAALAAEAAVEEAARWQLRLLEVEARIVLCDAYLCAGRLAELMDVATELEGLAAAMPSERFRLAAAFYSQVASGELMPAVIEKLAGSFVVAPSVARRSQALLGGEPRLDHVDLRVIESLVGSAGLGDLGMITAPSREDEWQAGWGIDHRKQGAWLPSGETVLLAQRPKQWRILETLSERNGSATKEELVLRVWDEREYHPGRHDSRLHTMIRKLRESIEDDPAEPTRLLTTDEGYELGPSVRSRR